MDKKHDGARGWWSSRDREERRVVLNEIKKRHPHLTITNTAEDIEYDQFLRPLREAIAAYHQEVIQPQEGQQQTRYDGLVEEGLPASFTCPRCQGPVKQVFSKRGIHYKCHNPSCRWDSNRPFDFDRDARRKHIRNCAQRLKTLFPLFNFVENYPYSPDLPLTGRMGEGKTNYDLSLYWMGHKMQRLRVEINQHLTREEFYESNYCYVIGIPSVVDYLAKRRGLVVHYLVDDPKNTVLMRPDGPGGETLPHGDRPVRQPAVLHPQGHPASHRHR